MVFLFSVILVQTRHSADSAEKGGTAAHDSSTSRIVLQNAIRALILLFCHSKINKIGLQPLSLELLPASGADPRAG